MTKTKMKKDRIVAILLSVVLVLTTIISTPIATKVVQAAALDVTQFASSEELIANFGLAQADQLTGIIKFGADGREWLIAGEEVDGQLVLFSKTEFDKTVYGDNSKYSTSQIKALADSYLLDESYFSANEQLLMGETEVSTLEPDQGDDEAPRIETGKLYIPDARDRNGKGEAEFYVGTNNDIPITNERMIAVQGKDIKNQMWLRSAPGTDMKMALFAFSTTASYVLSSAKIDYARAVRPAFALDISSVMFASNAVAATTSGELERAAAFTLRYSENLMNIDADTYLVIQNDSGAWATLMNEETNISLAEISSTLTDLEDCQIWLEKTDQNSRITTATMEIDCYDVAVEPGNNMSRVETSGNEQQDIIDGLALEQIIYQAEPGYYFPTSYGVEDADGLYVTRDSNTQITVTGKPYAATTLVLDDATEKTSQEAPQVTGAVEQILDTTIAMEYAAAEDAEEWYACAEGETEVEAGIWYVRYQETDTKKASAASEVTVEESFYSLEVSPAKCEFGAKNEGYEQPEAQTVTVKNTSNGEVILNAPEAQYYQLGELSQQELAVGESATFTICPKDNLAVGNYEELIILTDDKGNEETVSVSFRVNESFSVTITPDEVDSYAGKRQLLVAQPKGGSGNYTYRWYVEGEQAILSNKTEVSVSPIETTTYKVVVNDTIEDREATATVNILISTYTIEAALREKDFGVEPEGYTHLEERQVVIENKGNSEVTLIQPEAEDYEVGELEQVTLGVGEQTSFTIHPKEELAVGDHHEAIRVYTREGSNAEVLARFTVQQMTAGANKPNENQQGSGGDGSNDGSNEGSNERTNVSGQSGRTGNAVQTISRTGTTGKVATAPKTGDTVDLMMWLIIFLIAGGGMSALVVGYKRK